MGFLRGSSNLEDQVWCRGIEFGYCGVEPFALESVGISNEV
jgi:hypothetical protein